MAPNLFVRETGLVEWICPHGVGHPTADSVRKMTPTGANADIWRIHGCDGCCKTEPLCQEK